MVQLWTKVQFRTIIKPKTMSKMIIKDKTHLHITHFYLMLLWPPGAPQRPQLNWSHFKPEFAGKPEEDAEAHLLRTNNWMDTHNFPGNIKVQRFYEHGCFSFCLDIMLLDDFLKNSTNFVRKTSFCLISVKASSGLRKMFSQYYYNQNGVWENVCPTILDTHLPFYGWCWAMLWCYNWIVAKIFFVTTFGWIWNIWQM